MTSLNNGSRSPSWALEERRVGHNDANKLDAWKNDKPHEPKIWAFRRFLRSIARNPGSCSRNTTACGQATLNIPTWSDIALASSSVPNSQGRSRTAPVLLQDHTSPAKYTTCFMRTLSNQLNKNELRVLFVFQNPMGLYVSALIIEN